MLKTERDYKVYSRLQLTRDDIKILTILVKNLIVTSFVQLFFFFFLLLNFYFNNIHGLTEQ